MNCLARLCMATARQAETASSRHEGQPVSNQ